jgi:hypothetical protein
MTTDSSNNNDKSTLQKVVDSTKETLKSAKDHILPSKSSKSHDSTVSGEEKISSVKSSNPDDSSNTHEAGTLLDAQRKGFEEGRQNLKEGMVKNPGPSGGIMDGVPTTKLGNEDEHEIINEMTTKDEAIDTKWPAGQEINEDIPTSLDGPDVTTTTGKILDTSFNQTKAGLGYTSQ